jgi:hypothetical protein
LSGSNPHLEVSPNLRENPDNPFEASRLTASHSKVQCASFIFRRHRVTRQVFACSAEIGKDEGSDVSVKTN